jgi:predicted Rossmann fold flavoprotein
LSKQISIIGGGAAGFFTAINVKEKQPSFQVIIYERSSRLLDKVRVSGGGRCNVTNASFDPNELVAHYPRGYKEMLGPFHRFGPKETVEWFKENGVEIVTEADGRMFPSSNSSSSIINCFLDKATELGIQIELNHGLTYFERSGDNWDLHFSNNKRVATEVLVLTTGSSNAIWGKLKEMGLKIVDPVPSLFTFNSSSRLLDGLQGISFDEVEIKMGKWIQKGPLLFTHWGLSGPAILKLSAKAAIELHRLDYNFEIGINFLPHLTEAAIREVINELRNNSAKNKIIQERVFGLTKRFWENFCSFIRIDDEKRWAELDKKMINTMVSTLRNCLLIIKGKSVYKEEFVTAGGVDLKEMNFKTFATRKFLSLYLAGEVLNIDAETGGFNFQAAWTGAYIIADSFSG